MSPDEYVARMNASWRDGFRTALNAMKQELADFYAKRGDGGPLDPEDGYPWALSNMRGALASIWDAELPPREDVWPAPSWVSKSDRPTCAGMDDRIT